MKNSETDYIFLVEGENEDEGKDFDGNEDKDLDRDGDGDGDEDDGEDSDISEYAEDDPDRLTKPNSIEQAWPQSYRYLYCGPLPSLGH